MMSSSTVINCVFSVVFLSYFLQLAKAIPTVGFNVSISDVNETSGLISILLDRTIQTNITTKVNVELSGTATKDTDYIVSGSLIVTFPADNLDSQPIQIFIIDDVTVEPDPREYINLTIIADPAVFNLATQSHVVNISDNDVNIICQNVQISEFDGMANVTINRTGSTQALLNTNSIKCFTKDDSAVDPTDYTTKNSAITFTSSTSTQQMSIIINNDNVHEANETFKVTCYSNDKRVHIQDSCKDAVVTIQNDDPSTLPTVGFNVSSSDVDETSGLTTIYLERTVRTNIPTTVTVELSGSATRNTDYTLLGSLDVTFPAYDQTSKSIQIYIVDDETVEADPREYINLTITANPAVFNLATQSHVVYISDNDVNINCQNAQINESDGMANVTISRTGSKEALANNHSIGCFTKDDSAVEPTDYTTKNSAIIFTSPNETQQIKITINDNTVPEGNETFRVRCYTNDKRVHIQDSCKDALVTVKNDDTYAFICRGYNPLVREDAGRYSVDICCVGVLAVSHTIQLCRTSDGGAYASVTAGCDNVTFTANEDRKVAYIDIRNDTVGEQELKNFQIYLQSNDPAVTLNDTSRYDVTLQDDDNTFYLDDVSELTLTENTPVVNVSVTINRVGETSVPATVKLELDFFGANSADCTGTSPRDILFNANETSKNVTACTVEDDGFVEDDETFNITLSGTGSPISYVKAGKSERTVKLISDDVLVTCQGESLKEADGPANVTFNRTGATDITANNISCSTANGTAFSPTDFQSQTSTEVSFALNELTETLFVVLKNDRIVEANESFTVTCNTSDPRVVIHPSCNDVQINIINDDTYVFFCPGYETSIKENAVNYTARLCRIGVLEDTHTVQLCRTSDTGTFSHDYPAIQASCDTITFTAYEEVRELTFTVTNDTWGEQEFKTFNVSINTADPGVTFNDTTSYIVTIHDYLDNSFCFTDTTPIVYEENNTYVNLTIRRTGGISVSNASVIINTTPKTAETPDDYTEPIINHRLIFLVGETEKTVSVNIVDDKIVEDDQTFKLSLTGFGGSTVFPDCKTSTVTIVSNDVNIFCKDRRETHSVYENKGPVVMDFERDGSLQYSHPIRIRTIDGTARASKDYTAIDKTLTFSHGQTNKIEKIKILDNNVLESSKTFTLSVTSTDNRVYMICPGTVFTILNDDTFIKCANRSIEVSEESKTVKFTLKREGVLESASPIWFATSDITAIVNSDYKSAKKVNKTFLPGQVYMTLSVDIMDDDYKEDDETFSVSIGSYVPKTLTSGSNCMVVTIKDNDPYHMTEQQAQELLIRRRNFVIILVVAGVFMALVVITFISVAWCMLRRAKKVINRGSK